MTSSSHETDPATADTDTSDTESDPALGDEEQADWSGEGGAVPEGPATDPED